ncbi:MAG: altronate dehydratase family protein [Oscillospiraceae bacterium]|jgi:altronate hydrolase|nr:altronate dehydratase family protein [Oscillospiraceae bacterium]
MIKINELDNVAVVLEKSGIIAHGHKVALNDIKKGEKVIKYGFPIGTATVNIKAGEHVHTQNLISAVSSENEYNYTPELAGNPTKRAGSFLGYPREDGRVGIRNEIWIINTVGCVNKAAEKIALTANELYKDKTDGIFAVTHPYGCSQLGVDHENTQKILAGIARHPNAAGVLILGLGCENNTICDFKKQLENYNPKRVRFLTAQSCEDEVAEGVKLIGEIAETIKSDKREIIKLDKLIIGLKCGGSDAFSGITANPLAGRISDRIISYGGTAVLTETPEMFGAETILMNRCENENIFNKTVSIINNFKRYFTSHGQEVYENPSPGNKDGGITTLEEKSLGCVQKGGAGIITDVLNYGGRVVKSGLNLLDGPGNDIVSTTAMTAAGCHLILFTTGRGTPLGALAPTIKISTNSDLAIRKSNWTDYDAGKLLSGTGAEKAENELWDLIIAVAEGRTRTRSEVNGYREFAIFKNGVTL